MDIELSKLLIYGLRAGAVLAFWYLARRHLFAAAVVQGFCYPLYANLMIPVIPDVFAIEMGFVFGAVLLVEALRQGLARRIVEQNRGAIFVRLVLALFVLSALSYAVHGAAEYSRPAWRLFERLSREVLPCCIIALIPGPQELRRCWRVAFGSAAILTGAFLLVGLLAWVRGVSPSALRLVPLLGYYLGAGAGIGITFLIMSVYFLPYRKGWHPDYRRLLVLALVTAGVLALLSGTRSFVALVPVVVGLCLLFPPPQRFGDSRITILGTVAATAVLAVLLVGSSHRVQSAFSGQYQFLAERFEGRYGAAGLSGRGAMWRRGWTLFQQHPVWGAGEANSGVVQIAYNPDVKAFVWFRMHQHCVYLKYLGEQGVIGGVLLLMIIVNFLVNRLHMAELGRWPVATAVIGQGAWVLGTYGLIQAVVGSGTTFFLGAAFLVAALDSGKQEAHRAFRAMHATRGELHAQAR